MCFGIVSWPPVLTIVLRFPLSVVLMQVILKRVVKNLFIDYRQVLLQLGGGATSVFKQDNLGSHNIIYQIINYLVPVDIRQYACRLCTILLNSFLRLRWNSFSLTGIVQNNSLNLTDVPMGLGYVSW